MDLVSVWMEEQGNKKEWSRRICGECEGKYRSNETSYRGSGCRAARTEWHEIDMRQTEDGSGARRKLASSDGTHIGHTVDEMWKTGARFDYAIEPSRSHPREMCFISTWFNSVCLFPSHAPRDQASSHCPSLDQSSFLDFPPSRISDACTYWELELTIQPPYLR